MASARGPYGLPARPSDGYRGPIKSRIPSTSRTIPRSLVSTDQPETVPTLSYQAPTSNLRVPAKISNRSSPHHPPIPAFTSHNTRQGSTTDSSRYGIAQSHRPKAHHGSGSHSSGQSQDSSSRYGQSGQFSTKGPSTSEDPSTSQLRLPKPISISKATKLSRPSEDAAPGFPIETTAVPTGQAGSHQNWENSQRIYPELDRYRNISRPSLSQESVGGLFKLSTENLPPPTPNALTSGNSSQVSASPSTKFSASPGPSAYSRNTTPTSIASQSPGIITPSRLLSSVKGRQISPTRSRPPVTRRRASSITNEPDSTLSDPRGLAAVRESTTSSSSNSTVRELDRSGKKINALKLAPPPPSPPPRKSSQKFKPPKDGAVAVSQIPRSHSMPEESPSPIQGSPSRSLPPARPSREGTPNLNSGLFDPTPVIHSNLPSNTLAGSRRGSESSNTRPTVSSLNQLPLATKSASTSNLPSLVTPTSRRSGPPVSKKPDAITSAKGSRPPSPTPAPSFHSRFHFFGRKKSSTGEATAKREVKKLTRKGPVAGTGHEGYGRFGATKRRSGGPTLGRSHEDTVLSQESVLSQDSFLTDRMSPVVISGGVVMDQQIPNMGSGTTYISRESTDSEVASSSMPPATSRPNALGPSALPRGRPGSPQHRRPSDSSESDGPLVRPNLALRRSMQRLQISPDDPLRLPQPISTHLTSSSAMTSLDTSILTDDSHLELQKEMSKGSIHQTSKKLRKRSRSPRKWNFFSRSHRQESPEKGNLPVAAQVTAVDNRSVPFYAILDSEHGETSDNMDVKLALRDADVISAEAAADQGPSTRQAPLSKNVPPLLPSGRPSRLPQVGRIALMSDHREDRPVTKSFSRPFRASVQISPTKKEFIDPLFVAKGPTPPKSSTPVPDLTMEESTVDSTTMASSNRASLAKGTLDYHCMEKEFLAFSPRKMSEATITTSSSSSTSAIFASSTAVIPRESDPPVEDEIWDEYDDLLGDETIRARQSTTSSRGVPFPLEKYSQTQETPDGESPTVTLANRRSMRHSAADTRSSYCSADMNERIKNAFKLRPSSLSARESLNVPATQPDVSEKRQPLNRLSTTSSVHTRFSDCSAASSDYTSPLGQVNLRVGSMTVSKWLTFGHVLFSDLRHELTAGSSKSTPKLSILVVDGLGNDDWSFYAAETYRSADFYNLSPRAPVTTDTTEPQTSFPSSPTNHHQIQYLSHLAKFPFDAKTFDSVVYRFPAASPSSHYQNILSESHRVLKPGGYIELAVLDVDLNNMGNLGRRAIRQLKEHLHAVEEKSHISSASDLLVRQLGQGGFDHIRAARVGVPVASSIARTSKRVSSPSSSSDKKSKELPSLSEMMRDPSPDADAGITKMVARVGRWWYTRCYENMGSSGASASIWDSKALLQECEELGTSFKLMVCCARVPGAALPN